MRFDLFVSERNQREHGFIGLLLLGRRRVDSAGCFPSRSDAEFIFQFENDSLSRLSPQPADFRNHRDIRIYNSSFEIVHAHSAQDCEREFRSDAADIVN